MNWRHALPLPLVLGLIALLAVGLTLKPGEVPSPLIGKPAPAAELALLHAPDQLGQLGSASGKPLIVNFWASWCTPCLVEHPLLMALAARGDVQIIGVNYKDEIGDARRWLQRHGDPFDTVLRDPQGRAGLDWGVYGVPETFVLDAQGVIRHKHIGPLTDAAWSQELAPLLGVSP